jgi:hypothetical protein
LIIIDDLTFGDTLSYRKGSKKERFHSDAPILPEHRALYNGRTQERISLGSDPNKVEVKRAIEIAKTNKEHRNKIAAHDQLGVVWEYKF